MAYPGIKKIGNNNYNFFTKIDVNWSQFGAPDGYTIRDGYGPDLIIPFVTQGLSFINEGTSTSNSVEYSFDGINVHGDLVPTTPSQGLVFDVRVISLIWFRLKQGSTGPVTIRVEAWGF